MKKRLRPPSLEIVRPTGSQLTGNCRITLEINRVKLASNAFTRQLGLGVLKGRFFHQDPLPFIALPGLAPTNDHGRQLACLFRAARQGGISAG